MKTLILLLSVMMITGIATAKRSGHGSGNGQNYTSEQSQKGGDFRKHNRKQNQKRLQQRLRRITKGNEAEYNRLLKLSKENPKAFRVEMQKLRAERNKDQNKNQNKRQHRRRNKNQQNNGGTR